jgi:hypothetical protein
MIKEHNKKFFKDDIGLILFIFVYIAILIQMISIYTTYDDNIESNLFYHKSFFTIISILVITSHIKATITNPGMIDHDNNSCVCTFYLQVHHLPMERAKKIMTQGNAKMLFDNFNEEDDKDNEDDSDSDDEIYKPYSSISEETREHICKKFDVEFKRCDKCYIVRTPRVQHCKICKSCVMKMDHHCPWINNCIGQFNQKFFILFCLYSFIGCLHSCYLLIYYSLYRKKAE